MDLLAIALAKNDRERANKTIHKWIYVHILHNYDQSRIIPDLHVNPGLYVIAKPNICNIRVPGARRIPKAPLSNLQAQHTDGCRLRYQVDT